MEQTVSAMENPTLANEMVNKVLSQTTVGVPEQINPAPLPSDSIVKLAGGLLDTFTQELVMEAEIRELNGTDEEAIARINDPGRALMAILDRGVVSIGDDKATKDTLEELLAGDRELLLIEIRKATFGSEIKLQGPCPQCSAPEQDFTIDLEEDLEVKRLEDPVLDRTFSVKCKVGEVIVSLPTGKTQKKLIQASDNKTSAELDTMLLRDCIESINGSTVIDNKQILRLGMKDRRDILAEISKRNPGPQLSDFKKNCGACGQEVPLPLTIADLFRV